MGSFEELVDSVLGKDKSPYLLSDGFENTCLFRSFGVYAIDYLINPLSLTGGLPRGMNVEIYSPEGVGKTTLAITAAKRIQRYRERNKVFYIDFEQKFNLTYAKSLGLDPSKTYFLQPHNGEEGLNALKAAAESDDIGLIVVDSVPAITSKSELEGALTDANIAASARIISKVIKQINNSIDGPTIIWINQLRDNIGVMFGPAERVPGPRAIKYYSSLRLDLRIKKKGTDSQDIKVKTVKNQLGGMPYSECFVTLEYGKGFDNISFLLDKGKEVNVITKKGSKFLFNDKILDKNNISEKTQKLIYQAIVESNTSKNIPDNGKLQKEGKIHTEGSQEGQPAVAKESIPQKEEGDTSEVPSVFVEEDDPPEYVP